MSSNIMSEVFDVLTIWPGKKLNLDITSKSKSRLVKFCECDDDGNVQGKNAIDEEVAVAFLVDEEHA